MNTSLFSLSPLLSVFVIVLLLFLQIPSSVSNNDLFTHCRSKFVCGNITADFPFWGTGRPPACGIPELELKCENSMTKMKINKVAYRVLEINQDIEILRIAREDYLVGFCPPQLANSTFNPVVFGSVEGYTNLTFIYGCMPASIPIPIPGVFTCKINQVDYQSGYIQPGATGPGECYASVFVPVSADFGSSVMNLTALEQGLKEGFEVRWKVDRAACGECTRSSGVCGVDYATNQTTCYCPNQSTGSKTCGLPAIPAPGSSSIGKRHKIAIGISAAVAATVAFSVIAICYTRKESSSSGISMNFRRKNLQPVDRLETFMMDYRSLTPKRYSYADIKKITNSFTNILGEGGFGNVYKGKLPDGRPVAVKVLKESKGDGEEFMNEVASISRTSHVNIVTLLGFCYERTKRALIYEFMPKGSLDKFISYKGSPLTNGCLEWKKINEIAVGIARGLEYLHRGCNTRIVHFDIKPHNILLDEDLCPKISDFGLAKLCKSKVSKVSMIGARGTVGYIAPEVFSRSFGGVTYKSDVYSYGIMVLEMVGERKDFDIGSLETGEMYFPDWFYKHLEPGEILRVHESITEDEEEIVKKMILVGLWCIQTNPSERPSMTKVVEMLEGSLELLQIPPRPFLSSPKRSRQEESSTKSFLSSPKRSPKEESSSKSCPPRLSLKEGDL